MTLGLPQKVLALHDALTSAGLAHAFGGAIALAYYAVPRATIDIDINVFADVADAGRIGDALTPLGVDDGWLGDDRLASVGQARAMWDANPVDLFFSYDAMHDDMAERTRLVPFGDREIPVLAPEHLLACKAIFDRRKDWLDIEQMLLAADALDVGVARRWVSHVVGDSDARLARLDRAVADVLG